MGGYIDAGSVGMPCPEELNCCMRVSFVLICLVPGLCIQYMQTRGSMSVCGVRDAHASCTDIVHFSFARSACYWVKCYYQQVVKVTPSFLHEPVVKLQLTVLTCTP